MPELEVALRTPQGSEAPDWSGGENQFGGQRVDSSGAKTPSADCLSLWLYIILLHEGVWYGSLWMRTSCYSTAWDILPVVSVSGVRCTVSLSKKDLGLIKPSVNQKVQTVTHTRTCSNEYFYIINGLKWKALQFPYLMVLFWHISAHYLGFLSHSLDVWHRTDGYFQPDMKQCEDMPFNVLIAHTIHVLLIKWLIDHEPYLVQYCNPEN